MNPCGLNVIFELENEFVTIDGGIFCLEKEFLVDLDSHENFLSG